MHGTGLFPSVQVLYSCALDILNTSVVNNSNMEVWCLLCEMMWFEPCLPPHVYLNSGLPGASLSTVPFLFPVSDFLLSTCLKEQMALLPLHTPPSYLMSPLLAQGPPMSSDRNSHTLRIIAPTLLPLHSSRVQWAGCVWHETVWVL